MAHHEPHNLNCIVCGQPVRLCGDDACPALMNHATECCQFCRSHRLQPPLYPPQPGEWMKLGPNVFAENATEGLMLYFLKY